MSRNMAWEAYEVQEFLCLRLLALIESQAVYKFLVYSGILEMPENASLVCTINVLAGKIFKLTRPSFGSSLRTSCIRQVAEVGTQDVP